MLVGHPLASPGEDAPSPPRQLFLLEVFVCSVALNAAHGLDGVSHVISERSSSSSSEILTLIYTALLSALWLRAVITTVHLSRGINLLSLLGMTRFVFSHYFPMFHRKNNATRGWENQLRANFPLTDLMSETLPGAARGSWAPQGQTQRSATSTSHGSAGARGQALGDGSASSGCALCIPRCSASPRHLPTARCSLRPSPLGAPDLGARRPVCPLHFHTVSHRAVLATGARSVKRTFLGEELPPSAARPQNGGGGLEVRRLWGWLPRSATPQVGRYGRCAGTSRRWAKERWQLLACPPRLGSALRARTAPCRRLSLLFAGGKRRCGHARCPSPLLRRES